MAYDEDKATLLRERDLLLWLHAEAVHWLEFESAAAQSAEEDNTRLRVEHKRLRREVEFEACGATTFSGADAVAARGVDGVAFAVEDFGLDVDTDAGGIYVSLNHRRAARTEDWGPDVSVDYDVDGVPTGVEILRSLGSGSVFSEGGTPTADGGAA